MDGLVRPRLPWEATSPIKGKLAIGNLGNNLPRLLTFDGRIHVETLLTGVGAVGGFLSQNAYWRAHGLEPGDVPETGRGSDLDVVRLASGERYFFGDGLNAYLSGFKDEGPGKLNLWAFLRGAMVSLGLPPERHPEVEPMYIHVVKTLGSDGFGRPDTPGHMPALSARELTVLLWPSVLILLGHPPPTQIGSDEPDLPETQWPIVAFAVASQLMHQTRDHLAPDLAARLVMEAAIAASKIDPATVPRERPAT